MQVKLKRLIGNGIFLLGLLLLLYFTSALFQPKNNTITAGMEDLTANGILGEPEQTIDALFLTDSVGYCSIIPLQIWKDYGITSYVCGTPSQPLYYSIEFLEKALRKQSPKVVVLETMTFFTKFGVQDVAKNKIEQLFPIFRYHDRWKTPEKFLTEGMTLEANYNYIIADRGYRYFTTVDYPLNNGIYQMVEEVAVISNECREAIIKIKEICDENGAQLVFMGLPNACTWKPERYNAVAYLAMDLDVPYFEMNFMREEVPIDWYAESFDAGEHLNVWGAQKVTAFLGEYLDSLDIFEDKRMNKEYEYWNEAQKVFFATIGE